MKLLVLSAIITFACLGVHAQTFANYLIPNAGSSFLTNVFIPTNTIAKVLNFNYTGSVTSIAATLTFAGAPAFSSTYPAWLNTPIMGPVTRCNPTARPPASPWNPAPI